MKRRLFLVLLAMTTFSFTTLGGSFVKQRTSEGVLRGAVSDDGLVRAFKGVPYAAPPLGELRWREPQPVKRWKGVRDATRFGPRAMQKSIWDDMIFFDEGPSEDCLYLNIWIPEDAKPDKLPVMFWIHGGGFFAGGTSEARQEGRNLCQEGVIVVSVGYRMGVFGFLAHPELTADSPHGASGNYGLLDMVAALEWVQKNISSFGGDPMNVTIFGESAGSMAVSTLMASPLSNGLFAKAIGQSGSFLGRQNPPTSLAEAESTGAAFLEKEFGAKSLEELKAIDGEALLAAYWEKALRDFSAIVDGHLLEKPVSEVFANGNQSKVPLLAGWTLDESSANAFLKGKEATVANFEARAKENFGERAEAFLKVYTVSSDEEVRRVATDFASDAFIGYGTWKWIEEHARTGEHPVWRYRFDQALPLPADAPEGARPRAAHSWEIEYVFNVLDSKQLPWRDEDRYVSELMAGYWANFAKTGNPNGRRLPVWPAYSESDDKNVLLIDASPELSKDVHRERYLFWEER